VSVEGHLSDLGVVDVLHLICLRRRPAQLTVMQGGSTGRVVVRDGNIVHARVGALSGEGAVVELLGWRDGIFKVSEAPSLPERNVRATLTELMTWAARGRPGAPLPAAPAAAAAPGLRGPREDREIDVTLVQLFARLEREVARFEGLRPGPRSAGPAMAIVEGVLARIVETGALVLETGYDEAALRRLISRQSEITPALANARVERGRISLDGVRALLDLMPAGSPRSQLFDELAAGALGLVNGLLSQLGRSLGDDELRQQWRETFEAFLADLTGALDGVKS
jgi:hypothetical protein